MSDDDDDSRGRKGRDGGPSGGQDARDAAPATVGGGQRDGGEDPERHLRRDTDDEHGGRQRHR